ncbi:GR25 family glycosyltransferase involved in LPS biosynthesis [Mesorhizobium soli]|nr:GR25 family glycosyltransferase involved in LPS biosynthesis [Mesorhizobium soli]
MVLRAYVLTVDSVDGARRSSIARELSSAALPWQFVEGYARGEPAIRELYSPMKNLLLSKRPLADVEVAVYAGHRKIWQKIAEGDCELGLVIEDDARIVDIQAFVRALADLQGANEKWDVVKFFDFKPKRVVSRLRIGATQLVGHKFIASGAVAYLLSRDAARKLLSRKRVYRAVDEDFSHPWEFGLRIWSASPNPIDEASNLLGGSLLAEDRDTLFRKKNLLRSLYGELLQARKQLYAAAYHRSLAE